MLRNWLRRLAPQKTTSQLGQVGLSLQRLDDRIVPAQMLWTGGLDGKGGNWFDASNWNVVGTSPVQHQVPGPADDASLTAQLASGGPGTITFNGNSGVRSLNMVASLSITGTFSMGNGIFVNGNYIINSGSTLDIQDGASLQKTKIEGSGSLTLAASRTISLYATTIDVPTTNAGAVIVPKIDSISGFTTNANFVNQPGSSLWQQGGVVHFNAGLTNHGQIKISSTTGVQPTDNIDLHVADATNAADGTILAQAGGGGKARVLIASTKTLDNQGLIQTSGTNLTITAAATNATLTTSGPLSIGAGTTLSTGYFTTVNYNGGAVTGGGTWDWSQASTIINLNTSFTNTNVDLAMNSGTTVNGPGTLTLAAARTLATLAPVFNCPTVVQNGATLRITSGRLLSTSTFDNHGAIELTSVTGSDSGLDVNGPFTNYVDGSITGFAGTGGNRAIRIFDGHTVDNQGLIHVTGRNMTIAADNSPTPTFKTSGTLSIDAGYSLITGYYMNVNYLGGSVIGGGVWSVTGAFTSFNLNTDLTVPTANVAFDAGTTTNGPGQLIIAAGKSFTVGTTTINAAVVNQGVLINNGGFLRLYGGLTNVAGATVNIQATASGQPVLDIANGFTNHGTLNFDGNGTTNSVEAYVESGTVLNSPTGNIVSFGGFGSHRFRFYSGPGLNNQGTITTTGANFGFSIFGGTPTFQNSGNIALGAGTKWTSDGPLVNAANGILSGNGIYVGAVNGGVISPGASPGLLTINGNVVMGGMVAEINGATAGTQYDQLVVNGKVTAGGTLNVSNTVSLPIGTTLTLIDNDSTDAVVGNFVGLPAGASAGSAGPGLFLDLNYQGGTGNDVTLKALPFYLTIEGAAAQRSMVRTMTVTFGQQVSLGAGAFTIAGTTPGGAAINGVTLNQSLNGAGTVATITFTGTPVVGGSLPDGKYTLTVNGNAITEVGTGQLLDADGNGAAGGTYAIPTFRLFGDSNGDRTVDGADFLAFRLAFLGANTTFDYDANGQANGTDFLQFRLRFLLTV